MPCRPRRACSLALLRFERDSFDQKALRFDDPIRLSARGTDDLHRAEWRLRRVLGFDEHRFRVSAFTAAEGMYVGRHAAHSTPRAIRIAWWPVGSDRRWSCPAITAT